MTRTFVILIVDEREKNRSFKVKNDIFPFSECKKELVFVKLSKKQERAVLCRKEQHFMIAKCKSARVCWHNRKTVKEDTSVVYYSIAKKIKRSWYNCTSTYYIEEGM